MSFCDDLHGFHLCRKNCRRRSPKVDVSHFHSMWSMGGGGRYVTYIQMY